MNLEQMVEARIKEMYEGGKTQVEIAELCNVTQSYIQRLLSGKQGAGGITIRVFCRMFPNATVNLHGDHNTTINGSNLAIRNSGGSVVQSIDSTKFAQLQSKVIMEEGIPAEYKVAFLKLIEETK